MKIHAAWNYGSASLECPDLVWYTTTMACDTASASNASDASIRSTAAYASIVTWAVRFDVYANGASILPGEVL
jgi:hypothetical protein